MTISIVSGLPRLDDPKLVKIRDGMTFAKTRCNPSRKALRRARRMPPFLIRCF